MDGFSNLPDEVLCHILSFLTTKEAALTSILAKRWRNLLAFVPCLTLDNTEFLLPEEDREEIKKQSFIDFVDRVMTLQGNSPLQKFSLKCVTTLANTDRVRLDGWISNVLARCASDLDLTIITEKWDFYKLSPKCFECISLKIHGGIDIVGVVAVRVFVPLLKTLVLVSVGLCPNEFEILLHALPSLEELHLTRVLWNDMDVTVSSASLKTLTIELGESVGTLSFDTPSLVHFKCSGYVAQDYPVVNLGNLLDAQIFFLVCDFELKQLREPDDGWLGDTVSLLYSKVWKLFHGIRNVPNLDLSPDALEVLSLCYESMPGFNNLKSLTVKSNKDRGWLAMPALLRNCPLLETLVIKGLVHHVTDKCGDICDCISLEDKKGFSLSLCPVKVIKIHRFQGTAKEMAMIKHFLVYFPSLKKMEVYAKENNPTLLANLKVSKRVLKMFKLYTKLSSCDVQLCI